MSRSDRRGRRDMSEPSKETWQIRKLRAVTEAIAMHNRPISPRFGSEILQGLAAVVGNGNHAMSDRMLDQIVGLIEAIRDDITA